MNYDPDFYKRNEKFQRALSRKLTPWIAANLKINSAADFGCGCGYLIQNIADRMKLKNYVGINLEKVPNLILRDDNYMTLDLGRFALVHDGFDLVISLEVAEHIPASSADLFVMTLTRNAKKYIIFSAATPGQGGVGHVNEQPPEYWHRQFAKLGWIVSDKIRKAIANDRKIPFWYRKNICLYKRMK